jgi:hypothetical protein
MGMWDMIPTQVMKRTDSTRGSVSSSRRSEQEIELVGLCNEDEDVSSKIGGVGFDFGGRMNVDG